MTGCKKCLDTCLIRQRWSGFSANKVPPLVSKLSTWNIRHSCKCISRYRRTGRGGRGIRILLPTPSSSQLPPLILGVGFPFPKNIRKGVYVRLFFHRVPHPQSDFPPIARQQQSKPWNLKFVLCDLTIYKSNVFFLFFFIVSVAFGLAIIISIFFLFNNLDCFLCGGETC